MFSWHGDYQIPKGTRPDLDQSSHAVLAVCVTHLIAKELGLEPSSAWRRVKQALDADFLINDEVRSRQPAKLHPGEPMPAETSALPHPDTLEGGGGTVPLETDMQSCNLLPEEAGVLI